MVDGTVDLSAGPTLNASLGFTSRPGDSFTILTSTDGINGTFAGLPDGAHFSLDGTPMQIDYTTHSVVLTHRPQFFPPVIYPASSISVSQVVTGDFRGVGIQDLVATWDIGVSVRRGNGDGTFGAAVNYNLGHTGFLAVGDFNGDGKLDIVVVGPFSGPISVLLGNGDGTFQQPAITTPLDRPVNAIAVGDFDGDGAADLVITNGTSVNVLLGNGDGTFQTAVTYPEPRGAVTQVALGDFRGNGKLDIVAADLATNTVSVLLGNGDGTFQPAVDCTADGLGNGTRGVAVGDFDGDGMLDIVAIGLHVNFLRGQGDGTFADPVRSDFRNFDYGIVAVADFDRDGKPDIIVRTQTSVVLLYGTGHGSFQAPIDIGLPPTVVYVTAGDFNGDGYPDVAVYNAGTISVLINVGSGMGGSGTPGPSGRRKHLSRAATFVPTEGILPVAPVDLIPPLWLRALGTAASAPRFAQLLAPYPGAAAVEQFFAAATGGADDDNFGRRSLGDGPPLADDWWASDLAKADPLADEPSPA
jgi:hypothetical protein